MKTFEITIPYKKGPWYTVTVEAENAVFARKLGLYSALEEGFKGDHGKIEVREIN